MISPISSARRSVLIVDESEDSREVLRTALQRLDLDIYEASEARSGLELARLHHPRLIVLDLEVDSANDPQVCDSYSQQSCDDQSQMLLLGSLRRAGYYPPAEQVVSKPYHYAPLIRKIEELLENSNVVESTS